MAALKKMKSPAELRKFGLTMALVLTVLALFLIWRGRVSGLYLCCFGGLFLVAALLKPLVLEPIEASWLAFGEAVGKVVSVIVLSLTYYLVMTPTGLLLKLMGRDILSLKLSPEAKSYWSPVEENGPQSRPYQPY